MIIDIEVERNKERNESSNKIINLYASDAIWRIVGWNIFWYTFLVLNISLNFLLIVFVEKLSWTWFACYKTGNESMLSFNEFDDLRSDQLSYESQKKLENDD